MAVCKLNAIMEDQFLGKKRQQNVKTVLSVEHSGMAYAYNPKTWGAKAGGMP